MCTCRTGACQRLTMRRSQTRGMFGIPVIFGHRAISPEKWTFLDRRFTTRNTCKNSLLPAHLGGPFSDICFRTYRGVSSANAHLSHSASSCFFYTRIFSQVLVTDSYTYSEHTASEMCSAARVHACLRRTAAALP